ncbi:MAG: arsenate reductase ArsC [Deltaproteobacteria bacterium]|nr:arsenate reductase ArsC [Deltaproteobacteria bacterium]
MAEGFARHLAPNGWNIYSAGTLLKEIHPLAVRVMDEVGIDISAQRAKGIEMIPIETIDLLITLCGEAGEACPTLATKVERQHWSLRDPAEARGSEDEIVKVFRDVRDEVRRRVENLMAGDRVSRAPKGNDAEPKGEIVQR